MLATAALVVVSQSMPDPLAEFRSPDGRLTIPGRALTPELQRLLFHGNDLQPFTNVTFLLPARSITSSECGSLRSTGTRWQSDSETRSGTASGGFSISSR